MPRRVASWLKEHGEFWVGIALLLILAALVLAQREHDAGLRREDARQVENFIAVCSRNNVFKANDRVNIRRGLPRGVGSPANVRRNDKLLALINCKRTFEGGGKAVPLTRDQEERFLDIVANGRIPMMSRDGGRVVGSREAEQGALADF